MLAEIAQVEALFDPESALALARTIKDLLLEAETLLRIAESLKQADLSKTLGNLL